MNAPSIICTLYTFVCVCVWGGGGGWVGGVWVCVGVCVGVCVYLCCLGCPLWIDVFCVE